MPPIRQLLRRHGRWVLALASLLVGLIICELAVRLLRLAPAVHAIWLDDGNSFYQRSTHAVLNYEIRPAFSRDTRNGRATSNSHGFRDRERELAKPPGVRRVLMLGDSVVEGISYVDDESTLSRRLESLYPDGKTEVLNLGVSGYCTLAEVTLLKERGLAFSPDVVVLIFVANDFNNFNPEHTVGGGVAERPDWSKHLFVSSELFRYSALKFNWFQFAAEANPGKRNSQAIGDNNVVDGLRLLRELANQHGFQVLIVPWPKFTDTQIGYPNPSGPPPLLIERLAGMNGLPIEKIVDAFESVPNPRLEFTANGDEMHPNRLAADAVAKRLKELLDAPPKAPPYRAGVRDSEAIEIARWAASEAPQEEEMESRAYFTLMREARAEEALAHLRKILERDPDNAFANWFLGRDLFDYGRISEARPYLEHTVSNSPKRVEARTRLAYALNAEGKNEEAIKLLADGLNHAEGTLELNLSIGAIGITNGQFELAQRHLDIVRQRQPGNRRLHSLMKQLQAAQ